MTNQNAEATFQLIKDIAVAILGNRQAFNRPYVLYQVKGTWQRGGFSGVFA